jgi:hypothetical protein
MPQDGVKIYIEVLDEVFQLNVLHVMLELAPFNEASNFKVL